MIQSEWLYASLAILLGAHVVTLLYAAVVRARRATEDGDEGDGTEPDETDVCYCPECGAENDPGYRFCRNCVAELPGATSVHSPAGRRSQPN